ncbi:MAG: hypothetical protein D6694_08390 [Gammaproteobacteria bacterium]|nr:MAG: hypothetical protein D6694_08390 [Gammaproteobacteria bacterium]
MAITIPTQETRPVVPSAHEQAASPVSAASDTKAIDRHQKRMTSGVVYHKDGDKGRSRRRYPSRTEMRRQSRKQVRRARGALGRYVDLHV